MKTLLIVEDEKAIRMGIRSIVERAPVAVETVLDCKNGAEAWELLQSRPVDVLITDIRMPRMDGVELVEKSKSLPNPPISVVISGYDDFSYAVGAFRQGVRDYLLKPIERERVFELLKKLDVELEEKQARQENSRELRCHLYRSLILGGRSGAAETVLSKQQDARLFGPYVVICVSPELECPSFANTDEIYTLKEMDGHQALVAAAGSQTFLLRKLPPDCCAGISDQADDPSRLRGAYREAAAAREYAFVRGTAEAYAGLPAFDASFPLEEKLERIIQLLGAARVEEAQRALEQILFFAQNNKIHPHAFAQGMSALPEKILAAYGFLLEDNEGLRRHKNLWTWNSAFDYCASLQRCIADLFAKRAAEDQNDVKVKMHSAILYVRGHFRSDINMAMVSNQISMNYTQFSCLFKEYTGSNFLAFLKTLRLEEGKKLLAQTDDSIKKIAKESGFQNEKHFMKSFKQSVGVSPSDYRKNIQRAKQNA